MKKVFTASLLVLLLAAAARAESPALSQVFADAGKAYDAGNFTDAAGKYQSLLDDGIVAHEIFFNLGNALYKQGRTGEAVLNYRRSWMLAPRDPDAEENLRLAAQNTKALLPSPSLATVLFSKLNLKEWFTIGWLAYWLGAALLAFHLFMPSRRPLLRRLLACTAVALAFGAAGTLQWIDLYRRPELVVLDSGQQALFAPMANSTPHFALPVGSVVRMTETSGPWVKVAYGNDSGWLRAESCAQVYPWVAKRI